jgi:phage terminase large subunit
VKKNNVTTFELSDKQLEAYNVLTEDRGVSELVFGGGARGGKTFLGAFWIISECVAKPGSAWLVGRKELTTLFRTTLITFFEVLAKLKYEKDKHYTYNGQYRILKFVNGSIVFFSEINYVPTDPHYNRLGSYSLTGCWYDEAQEIHREARDVIQARFTLLSGNGWEAKPKALYTCNPERNWIYSEFWKPLIKEKTAIESRQFIVSLYTDNPYIKHEEYKKSVINTKNKILIERLLYGNFEYDDSPNRIFDYDSILDMFHRKTENRKDKYISCDVARLGRDTTRVGLWHGLQLVKVYTFDRQDTAKTVQFIQELEQKENVRRSHIVIDEDGVGGGVVDQLKNCKGFVNNSSPIGEVNYSNLKTQAYFKLADYVNEGKIGIDDCLSAEDRQKLIEELDVVQQVDIDKDSKIKIISKDKVKELIGRSPDLSDMLAFRMFFEIQPKKVLAFRPI